MLNPSYNLQITSESLDKNTSDDVLNLYVNLDVDVPVSIFDVTFRINERTLAFKKNDEINLSLGYDDNLNGVFKGKINSIKTTYKEISLRCMNSSWDLINQRVNKIYENQTAGNIVNDLVDYAGIDLGEIMDGLNFPFYIVEDDKNIYEHIRELANRCEFDDYITHENKLNFKKYSRKNVHIIQYKKNLFDLLCFNHQSEFSSVKVFGESPSSTKGSDTWHWLTKEDIEGVKGSGLFYPICDPTIKDKDAAERVAEAKLNEIKKGISLHFEIIGMSQIQLDDTAASTA